MSIHRDPLKTAGSRPSVERYRGVGTPTGDRDPVTKLAGRGRYRPLYRQPLFTTCTRNCPNAERLTRDTFQVPVHPGMSEGLLGCLARIITELSQRVADGKIP